MAEESIELFDGRAAVAGGEVLFGLGEGVGGELLTQLGDLLAVGAEALGGFEIVPARLRLAAVGTTAPAGRTRRRRGRAASWRADSRGPRCG
ncbi:MAG: hypothetical protein R3C10_07690 [Pirellulales bacterium]